MESEFELLSRLGRYMNASRIMSPTRGIVANIQKGPGDKVDAGDILLFVKPVQDDALRVKAFIPAAHGKDVRQGQTVYVSPANSAPQRYGYLLGVVDRVGTYPTTFEHLVYLFKNQDWARTFAGKDVVVEVEVSLIPDPGNPTGFRWSGKAPAKAFIRPGTLCEISSLDLKSLLRGVELARDVLDEKGVCGRRLDLRVLDDGGGGAQAALQMQTLCDDPSVTAVIGGRQRSTFEAMRPLAAWGGLPLISPLVTPEAAALLGPPEPRFGNALQSAIDRSVQRDEFGSSGVVGRAVYPMPLTAEFIKGRLHFWEGVIPCDTLVLSGDARSVNLVLGMTGKLESPPAVVLTEEASRAQLSAMAIPDNLRVYLLSSYDPGNPKPANTEFVRRFRQAYGEDPDWLAAKGYDALLLVAAAIQAADSTAPERVRAALQAIRYENTVTPSPYVAFDEDGCVTSGAIAVQCVQDANHRYKNRAGDGVRPLATQ